MSDSQRVKILTATESGLGQRIDNFLVRKLKGVPKSHVYKIIRTGQVRVNKKRIKPVYKINLKDEIRIPPVRIKETYKIKPGEKFLERINNSVIYEDKFLLVVNKPAGIAVHGGSGLNFGLIEAMRQLYPYHHGLELAHRLDKDTSGCLIIAKKRSFLRLLHSALREGKVHKCYLALLSGKLKQSLVKCDKTLKKDTLKSGERMVKADTAGKDSLTIFTVKQRFSQATLVEAELITGRTHQIRVHAQSLGHPVAGDSKYGDEQKNKIFRNLGLRRMFLHADKVKFPHPEKGEISLSAPLGDELVKFLAKL